MKIKSYLYFLGLSCFPISVMDLINIFYSFYFQYLENIYSYTLVMILSLLIGIIFFQIGKKNHEIINIYDQLFLVILVYIFISFFIAVPYLFSGYNISFIDSFFESISGITGTGFTIFETLSNIDSPLILWRSSSQWLGGFYFLIFLVLVFSNKQINFKFIDFSFNFENKINLSKNLTSVTGRIFLIYISLTLLIFFIFILSDVRLLNSLNLSMTLISSGGFLPTDKLDEIIFTNFQLISISIAFIISILNFYLFYNLVFGRDKIKQHLEDFYIFIMVLIFSSIFYFLNNQNILYVIINTLSSIGTSGISIIDVPDNFSLYFIILTLFGGAVLSNTSGIKFMRFYILIKAFLIEINKLVKPNVIMNVKLLLSEKKINSDNIKMSFLIFIFFFLSLFILSSILLLDVLDFENSFKLSILTLTNTVNSNIYGIDKINFSEFITFSKISLIIFMLIAKIELITIFILIQKFFIKD